MIYHCILYLMYDEKGVFSDDNDYRCVFFTRGVIETVKKLNWSPDVIHCHGWISALMPVYIKRAMNVRDNPLFNETKIVYSIYDDGFKEDFKPGFDKMMKLPGMTAKDLKYFKEGNYVNLTKAAIDYSDGIVVSTDHLHPEIEAYLIASKKPFLSYQDHEPELNSASWRKIEKEREELPGNFCRGCGYCMPCPAGIMINQCARMSLMLRRAPSKAWLTPEMQAEMKKIEGCLNCRKCTTKCPYELDTPELLRKNYEDYKKVLAGEVAV